MARKRERFERTDVPSPSPRRNAIGAVVCVAALAAAALVVVLVWNHVSQDTNLGDVSLGDAIGQQAAAPGASEGYVATEGVSCTLLLTGPTASTAEQGATLSAARILAVNEAQGTASLVSLPVLDLALTVDGGADHAGRALLVRGLRCLRRPRGLRGGRQLLERGPRHVGRARGGRLARRSGHGGPRELRIRAALAHQDQHGRHGAPLAGGVPLRDRRLQPLRLRRAPRCRDDHDEGGNAQETGRQVLDQTQLGLALGTLAPAN